MYFVKRGTAFEAGRLHAGGGLQTARRWPVVQADREVSRSLVAVVTLCR